MILKDLFIFVNIYDILIDFLWSYEQKKNPNKHFMLDSLYFSFAINTVEPTGYFKGLRHVQSSVSQQSFILSRASTASQSWAVLTYQATEAEGTD